MFSLIDRGKNRGYNLNMVIPKEAFMTEILISAYEWLICLGEAVVVFLLFKSKFTCKKPKLYFAVAALPAFAAFTFVMNIIGLPWVVLAPLCAIIHIVYALVLFEASTSIKCIWSVVPSVIFCISNFIYLIIFYVLTRYGDESLVEGNPVRIIGQLIYTALNFAILLPLLKIKNEDGELPTYLRAIMIVLSLIGIAVSMYCFSELVSPEAGTVKTSSWIQCSALLLMSTALLVLSGYLSRLYYRHLETQRELQKNKLEAEHVSQVGAMYDYVREWRHDIKGMVSTVSSLADNGEYESMKNYLHELSGAADETKLLVSTGNPAVDAAVSAKLMLADKTGITVDHTISVPEGMDTDSMDICSVIMNLMDNAIEAVSVLPPEVRRIELEMIDKGGMLAVNVKNPCRGDYNYDGSRLVSSKPDSSVHGIGLKRVEKIVAKHQGFIKVSPKEHSFEVNILIPTGKEQAT